MAAILLSDHIHGEPRHTTLAAITVPALIATSTIFFSWLSRGEPARLWVLWVAALLSQLLYVLTYHPGLFEDDPWKYGLATPVILLSLIIIGRFAPKFVFLALMVFTAYSVVDDLRSTAGVCVISAILLFLAGGRVRVPRPRTMIIFVVSAGISFMGYSHFAATGDLGANVKAKYEIQAQGDSLILAGRPELVLSYYAIQTSPWIGLGSSAPLSLEAQYKVGSRLELAGAIVTDDELTRLYGSGVDSHSYALSAWVRAGILGLLPWLFLLYQFGRAFCDGCGGSTLKPALAFGTLMTSWNILFSPYMPHDQILLGILFAIVTSTTDIDTPAPVSSGMIYEGLQPELV